MVMENGSQADKAYDALKQMVIERKLRPGDILAVPELAEQLEMSITPLRDAIRRLDAEGLLEVIPRRGTFVRNFTIEDMIIGYEAAEALEGMASYLVAEHVQRGEVLSEELDVLDQVMEAMEKHVAVTETTNWGVLDARFHDTLCVLSRNRHIWQNAQNVKTQLNCVLWFVTPLHVDRNNSNREHRKIMEAIRRGDPEEARRLTQNHKNNVRGILLRLLPTM